MLSKSGHIRRRILLIASIMLVMLVLTPLIQHIQRLIELAEEITKAQENSAWLKATDTKRQVGRQDTSSPWSIRGRALL